MQKSSLKGSGANTWQASGMGQTLSQPESMKKGAVDVSRGWCFRVLKHVISKMTYKLRQHLGFFGIIVMSVLAKLRAPSLALQSIFRQYVVTLIISLMSSSLGFFPRYQMRFQKVKWIAWNHTGNGLLTKMRLDLDLSDSSLLTMLSFFLRRCQPGDYSTPTWPYSGSERETPGSQLPSNVKNY